MNIYKLISFVAVSMLVAILLASTLNSSIRIADRAFANEHRSEVSNRSTSNAPNAPATNYLPVIFLNATADSFWSLYGNAGTINGTHFVGTTDNVTLTFRVSNTVALRVQPSPFANYAANLIGGVSNNYVNAGMYGAVIAGGGSGQGCSGPCPNRVTDTFGTVGGGRDNQAGDGAGDLVNASFATVAGGFGNIASGTSTTIAGGENNSAADSYATVGGGYTNTANGYQSTVGGGANNTASGLGSATVSGGYYNTASGDRATIGGGTTNIANATRSTVPGGANALASNYGQMAYASGRFSTNGDAQTSLYVMRNDTTDLSYVELFLNGVDERIYVPGGSAWAFDILVIGRSDAGESAAYHFVGAIEHYGTNTTLLGTVIVSEIHEDDSIWDADIVADNTTDTLEIQVRGNTGDNVRWVAMVRTVEVSF